MIMSSFLPLLREFIPSAASEIESEIDDYMSKGGLVLLSASAIRLSKFFLTKINGSSTYVISIWLVALSANINENNLSVTKCFREVTGVSSWNFEQPAVLGRHE